MNTRSTNGRARLLPSYSVLRLAGRLALPVLFAAASVRAEPREIASSFTLDQAVSTALRDNAQLRAMRAKWEAMQERPAQERTLPNPMLAVKSGNSADNFRFPNTQETRVEIEQTFPWFGKLALRGKMATKEAEAMQREYETMAREIVMMVKETYFDLAGIQQSCAITRGDQAVLEQMLKVTENQYATGQRSQQDAVKAQSEITMLKQKLLDYDQEEAVLKAKLAQLLNTDIAPTLIVTAPLEQLAAELPALLAAAGTARPEIKKAEADIQRSRYERDLMQKEFYPDYRVGVEYGYMQGGFSDFSGSDNLVMLTISFDLPIWQKKYRAGVRAAEKMIEASQATLESTRRQVTFDVQDATFKLHTAQKTLELYRKELLPQAELRFKTSEAAYRNGNGEFLDLLESERFRLNARVMTAMAEANLGMQAARLERAVGMELPKTEEKK
ncbi:MAG: TolC family protein [Verrucomicrobiota bacterium]